MVKLYPRGITSAIEIIIYITILIISIILVLRHGFTKRAGWILLVVLSIIRIVGGVTHILSEQNPRNTTLRIIYGIAESSGVSPLLVATLGFLATVGQGSLETHPLMARGLPLMGILGMVGLVLAIIGGVNAGNAKSQSDLDEGTKLRHIGVIMFAVLYGLIVVVTAFCWSNKDRIMKHRQTLLTGITCALPFIALRVVYSVLSSFSPATIAFNSDGQMETLPPSDSPLANFGSTGPWLVLSVMMEYIAVVIYTVVGTRTPLEQDVD